MKPKYKRLWIILATLSCFGSAVALVLMALQDNITYFYTPSAIQDNEQRRIRLGGYVKKHSVTKSATGITFTIADMKKDLVVKYSGIVPDLFRDSQGVIAEGKLQDGVFIADRLLAKHDENYKPPFKVDK